MEISVNLRVLRVSVAKKQLMYVCCVVLFVAGLVGAADKTNSGDSGNGQDFGEIENFPLDC